MLLSPRRTFSTFKKNLIFFLGRKTTACEEQTHNNNMTTTEDFWKGILVVLNISVWLGRLRNGCNSVFLHVWSKSPEHPFCIFELCDCFNSSISDLQDSHLFLKFHQQVQKQLSSYNDLPFNKIQQITIITTAHTDFPRYSNTVLKFNLVILTQSLYQKTATCTTSLSPQNMPHLPGSIP